MFPLASRMNTTIPPKINGIPIAGINHAGSPPSVEINTIPITINIIPPPMAEKVLPKSPKSNNSVFINYLKNYSLKKKGKLSNSSFIEILLTFFDKSYFPAIVGW